MRRILLIALVLLFCFVPVYGATLQVCKVGCTYSTIQSAINAASAGDTIDVTDGQEYREKIIINKANIAVKSSNVLQKATIVSHDNSSNVRLVYVNASNVTLDGFNLKFDGYVSNPTDMEVYIIVFSDLASKSKILNNFLTTNVSAGLYYIRSISISGANELYIANNIISDNVSGVSFQYAAGIYIDGNDHTIASNSIHFSQGPNSRGVVFFGNNSVATNNTISASYIFSFPNFSPSNNHTISNTHISRPSWPSDARAVSFDSMTTNSIHFRYFDHGLSKWHVLDQGVDSSFIYNHNLSNNVFLTFGPKLIRTFSNITDWNNQRIRFFIEIDGNSSISIEAKGLVPNSNYTVLYADQINYFISDASGKLNPITIYQESYNDKLFEIRNSSLYPNPPVAPNITFADATSSSKLMMEWKDDSFDEDGWQIQKSVDGSTWSVLINITSTTKLTTGNKYTYNDSDLSINGKYYYRIATYSNLGLSDWKNAAAINPTTGNSYKYTRSNSPINDTFGTVTINSIQSKWTANSNPSETQYFAEACTSQWNGCINSGWVTSISHTFTGLSSSTSYHFKVKSRNGDNVESAWTILGSKSTLANAPMNPSHDSQTTTQIRWTWQSGGNQKDYFASNSAGNSGWTISTFWTQSGLSANTQYITTIKARNNDDVNTSTVSHSAYTSIQSYSGVDFGTIAQNSISIRPSGTFSNLASGSSGTYIEQVSPALNSGWRQNNNYWNSTGLSINTQYCYKVNVRNGDGDEIGISAAQCKYTLTNPPVSSAFTFITSGSITSNWNANSNPASTQYLAEHCTDASFSQNCANSNWIQETSYTFSSLTSNTTYHFRVRSRNGDLVNSSITSLGNATTLANPPVSPSFGTITSTSEEIIWSANNPSNTQYHIDHSTDGTTWNEVAYTIANNFIHNDLIPNTKHYYKIAAKNSLNQFTNYVQTNPVSKHTLANPPGALSFSSNSNSITPRWTSNGNSNGTVYYVEMCTSQWSNCVNSNWIQQTSYTFNNVDASTLYYFRVRAKNGDEIVTSWTDLGSFRVDGNAPTIALSYPSGIDPDVPRNFPVVFDVNDNGGVNNNTCHYNLTSVVNNVLSSNVEESTSCPDGRKVVWITVGPVGDCKTYSTSAVRRTCSMDYSASDSIGNNGPVLQKSFSPVSGLIHLDNFEWCTKSICPISETPFSVSLISGTTGQQYSIKYFTEVYNSGKAWRATQGSGSNIFQMAAKVGGRSAQDSGYEMPDGSTSDLIAEVRVDTAATFSFAYRVSTESGKDHFEFSILKTGGGSLLNPTWETCRFPIIGGYQVSGNQEGEYQSLSPTSEIDITNAHCKVLEPGTYRFRWRYAKNALNFAGDDSVQIDNFKIQEYQI